MSMPLISMPKAPTDQHWTEQGKWRWDWFDRYTLWFHVFILGTIRCRERFFSSYHERGTKKKFWVPMRSRTSDLRIPRSDALPLSHRLYGELSDVLYQLNAWHRLNNIIFKERCWLFCRSFRTEKYIWIPMRNRTACIPSLKATENSRVSDTTLYGLFLISFFISVRRPSMNSNVYLKLYS